MSLDIIVEQIKEFLNTDKPEVLSIKGAWGIGKTFLWNQVIKEQREKIKASKYSYVSLFGINSISEFKATLFAAMISTKEIGEKPSLKSFSLNITKMISLPNKGFKFLNIFPWINKYINITPQLVEELSYLFINNSLICIDDFERKGNNLTSKDILGIISQLKEQKNCKIALIINDEYLKEDNKKEYEELREKVIDTQLLFDPNPIESANIAFSDNNLINLKLKEFSVKLGINNIRILKKAERLSLILKNLLENYNHEILYQCIQTLILFCWSYFSTNDNVPKLDFIINNRTKFLSVNKEDDSEQEKNWKSLLREYEYHHLNSTDDLDLVIADAVQSGYFKKNALLNEVKKIDQQMKSSKSYELLIESWNLYHDSFDDNEDLVVEALYKSFNENYKFLSPNNLDGMIQLFRKLGKDDLADEAIKTYVEGRKDEIELFNLSSSPFSKDIKDLILINIFNKIYQTSKMAVKPNDILEEYLRTKVVHDKEILIAADIDFYYHLFKKEKGERLNSLINICILLRIDNALQALQRIAKESALNEARLAKYGISLNADTI